MDTQHEPKITGMEAFIMLMFCVLLDIAGIIATLLDVAFGTGEFIKFFIGIIASAIIFFWAIMKGVRSLWVATGGILELVPFINTLPLYTITMAITIYLDRYPEKAEVVQAASPRVVNPKRSITPARNAASATVKKTTPPA